VAAQTIAEKYRDLSTILGLDHETMRAELGDIYGIGPKIAASVAAYFADPKARAILEKLLALGVVAKSVELKTPAPKGALLGKSFCITGVLSQPRQVVQEQIRAAGGEVHERIKQNTNFLIAGDKVGKSKLEAAQKLGVKVLSEGELETMMHD
jgi:DNA ligase (NAD+)